MDFTIVTACNKEYLDKLKWTLPTWKLKPQFASQPILIFYNGLDSSAFDFVKLYFKDVTLINWNMEATSSVRELMLSSFVYAANYVKTNHYVKIDADVLFTSKLDVFEDSDLEFDLVAHPWGYTKPGYWIDILDNYFFNAGKTIIEDPAISSQARIISFCCLHKTEFVKEVIEKVGARLPIPSHDTLLWFCAEKFENRKWRTKNVKKLGVEQKHTFKGIREAVCSSPLSAQSLALSLLKHVQLEITTNCNLGCFNCDRNCGTAPSDEHMSISQIAKFVSESISLGHQWERIDIIGGEPTMHPELASVINVIKIYKDKYPKCVIRLSTNGLGKSEEIIKTLPSWVKIRNSNKKSLINSFDAYNSAPIDRGETKSVPCSIPWRCGVGLTRYGYFPCGAGASLCRVFGFDIGVKSLKDFNADIFQGQINKICILCGHSNVSTKHLTQTEEISPSWKVAISNYLTNKTKLTEI